MVIFSSNPYPPGCEYYRIVLIGQEMYKNRSWIRHARKLIKSPEYRLEQQKLIIYGSKIINEYIKSSNIINSNNNNILKLAHYECNDYNHNNHKLISSLAKSCNDIIGISRNDMSFITGQANPEGPIAEISWPNHKYSLDPRDYNISNDNKNSESDKLTIVLYGLSDSSNIGSIFRSVLALGWDRIILKEHSAHPFGPESIRSSMGATLMTPFTIASKEILDQWLLDNHRHVLISDCEYLHETHRHDDEKNNINSNYNNLCDDREGLLLFKWNNKRKNNEEIILVMGSESHGTRDIPPNLKSMTNHVKIRTSIKMPSLNVSIAAAIIMAQLNK